MKYLLLGWLLLTLCLTACQSPSPTPADLTPTPAPPTLAVERTATSTPDTATAVATTIAATATRRPPTATATPAPLPVIGGLAHPDAVSWQRWDTLDPLAALLSRRLHQSLIDPLTGEAALAESWEIEGDTATFTLPDNLTWSDGVPLQAEDVADVLEQAMQDELLLDVENIRVRGDTTLEVTVSENGCPTFLRVATWPIVDDTLWPPKQASNAVAVTQISANEWQIEPDGFIYRLYQNETELRDAWVEGEIDSIIGASRLTQGTLPNALRSQEPSGMLAMLMFRLADPVVQDETIRQVLTLSIERAALYETAYGSPAPTLLSALLPAGHWASTELEFKYDPQQAQALLAEAGYVDRNRDGLVEDPAGEAFQIELLLNLSQDEQWEALGHALAAQWTEIGVDTRLLYVEPFALTERLHENRWQVALTAYAVAPDPDQQPLWTQPEAGDVVGEELNVMGYDNPTVTDLLERAATVPDCNLPDRAGLYADAWRELWADRPAYPLFALPLDQMDQAQ